jgi:hypothetical protein
VKQYTDYISKIVHCYNLNYRMEHDDILLYVVKIKVNVIDKVIITLEYLI